MGDSATTSVDGCGMVAGTGSGLDNRSPALSESGEPVTWADGIRSLTVPLRPPGSKSSPSKGSRFIRFRGFGGDGVLLGNVFGISFRG